MQKSVHTKEYKALRAELRAIREAAGLSQRDLAARLKVPHSWVAKVEAGERRIDLVEFVWVVSACDGEPNVVFDRLFPRDSKANTGKRSAGGHTQ
jgi:transcriptional regulator with XRE-family HTH domain